MGALPLLGFDKALPLLEIDRGLRLLVVYGYRVVLVILGQAREKGSLHLIVPVNVKDIKWSLTSLCH